MSDYYNDSVFSLENDDASQLFITQSSNNDNRGDESEEDMDTGVLSSTFLGVAPTDFQSPCVSLIAHNGNYSDISEPEAESSDYKQR